MKAVIKQWVRAIVRFLPQFLKEGCRFGFVPGVKSLGTGGFLGDEVVAGVKIIHKSWVAERRLPICLNRSLPEAFCREEKHILPGAATVILPHGKVLGREGVVFDREGYLIAEPARQLSVSPYDWRELYRFVRPRPIHVKGRWGVLTGCGCNGYFHWMLDVLPRVALIREITPELDGWLVGAALEQPFVRQSLELMGIPIDSCREVGLNEHLVVDELAVASCPSDSGNPPGWVIDLLRTMIPEDLHVTSSLPRRFVVSRGKVAGRKIINEDELMARLANHQFQSVLLEEMSLVDQIRLFANAEMIVAPHGAGLTNLCFASPYAKVVEVFGDDYINVCFWALADILRLNYCCLVVNASKTQIESANSGEMEISKIDFEFIHKWASQKRKK